MSPTSSRPSTPQATTYVKARCHCGLNEFRAGFPTSALPISSDLCHCSSCRHSSGQMAVYHVDVFDLLCHDSDEPFHFKKMAGCDGDGDLIAYQSSNDGVRYSCSVCSSQLFFRYLGKVVEGSDGEREGGYLRVAAGALERTEGIVKPGYHIYVQDTIDGGLADHLRSIAGVDLPRYSLDVGSEKLPPGWKDEKLSKQGSRDEDGELGPTPTKSDDTLHFSCHCKSVQFGITRPSSVSSFPSAAYPDLLYPHDTTRLSKVRNFEDTKWWLHPPGSAHPTKYLAGHCACVYCRLTSGFELQSWLYVPLANIVDREGKSFTLFEDNDDEDLRVIREAVDKLGITQLHIPEERASRKKLKGLKQYISSPGRYREFCPKCGATVFAWQAGRPDLICAAVGLVDETQDGARAEGWFTWCLDRVGFSEQAVSPATVGGLLKGMQASKIETADGVPAKSVKLATPLLPVRAGIGYVERKETSSAATSARFVDGIQAS
ncbi:hypothetical protein FA15DRAFT_311330 [Coprinopsis marcescibilis]|uniref:CENP-V/GFA domain-containing protein n=1 Tax=Coprinopsis marcescibilis TaxID=230819 RepID=A0A5C3L1Q1_COPMA|nr:hypothetical protein FA15DRAFT_311330 [Coprinopsis marcescibilis]